MKETNRFVTTLFLALLVANSLPGCATGPILVDGQLQFPEYKFSVDSPPREWMIIEPPKGPGAVMAWRNSVTNSVIGITAGEAYPGISLRKVVESFKAAMTKGPPDDLARKFPGAGNLRGSVTVTTVTIEEDKEINFEGNMFHHVILTVGLTPVTGPLKGISLSSKMIIYFFRVQEFIHRLHLNADLTYYEKDVVVLDQMARSLRILM